MADPMQTLLGTDSGADAMLTKAQSNFARRHCWDQRVALDQAVTVLATDERIDVSAATAPRALQLGTAVGANTLRIWIRAADVTNTFTLTRFTGQTINGAAANLVYTTAKKLELVPDDVSDFVVFDMT